MFEQAFEKVKGVTAKGSFWWEPGPADEFVLSEYVRDGGQFPPLSVHACAGWSDACEHRLLITASDDGTARACFASWSEGELDPFGKGEFRIQALEKQALAALTANFREMAAAIMTVGVVDNWELDDCPPDDTKYHEATAWYWRIESSDVREVARNRLRALDALTSSEYRDLIVAEVGDAAPVPPMLSIKQLQDEADRIDPKRSE